MFHIHASLSSLLKPQSNSVLRMVFLYIPSQTTTTWNGFTIQTQVSRSLGGCVFYPFTTRSGIPLPRQPTVHQLQTFRGSILQRYPLDPQHRPSDESSADRSSQADHVRRGSNALRRRDVSDAREPRDSSDPTFAGKGDLRGHRHGGGVHPCRKILHSIVWALGRRASLEPARRGKMQSGHPRRRIEFLFSFRPNKPTPPQLRPQRLVGPRRDETLDRT